ncbi:MAG TPA: DNA primase [Firmicutes bacterium]|nr:DNA primase [Bacillota bacterium]
MNAMSGLIPEQVIAEVRERNDIVAVISEYVELRKAGKNWKGLCPFHREKTPSFNVNPEEQFYYCFGCGAGGNVINFLMAVENISFREAVERLAERAGIPVRFENGSPEKTQSGSEKKRLLELHRAAHEFFQNNLFGQSGGLARQYLTARGIQGETARVFGLGYAPAEWRGLLSYLERRGFSEAECLAAGLASEGRGSRCYDRFRGRLMFPVCDGRGQPIAFGGRVLDASQPKYLNSPETLIFTKGNNLYRLDLARRGFREKGFAVLVEGYMDVISLYQAGFDNTVAALGTALTEYQARLLKRFTQEVVIAFDGDAAGEAATWRGLEILRQQGLRVRVAELPGGEDPDTFIRTYGGRAFEELLNKAPGLTEFKLGTIIRRADLSTVDGKVAATGRIIEVLAELDSPVEQNEYLRWAAGRLKISEDVLAAELEARGAKAGIENSSRHRISSKSNNRGDGKDRDGSRKALGVRRRQPSGLQGLSDIEAALLRLLLHHRQLIERVKQVLYPEDFRHPVAQRAMECLLACHEAGHLEHGAAVFDYVKDASVQQLIAGLLTSRTSLPPVQTCMHYVRRLQVMHLKDDLKVLEDQIGQVEQEPVDGRLVSQLSNLLIKYRQLREEISRGIRT